MTRTESVLVVAASTATADELVDAMRSQAVDQPTYFTLVVPAEPGATRAAADRLDDAITQVRLAGLRVSGRVGEADPLVNIDRALDSCAFDRVLHVGEATPAASRPTRLQATAR
jgi:hypothetical protein